MPKCGSQCILCDIPIRLDTYVGCSHGCKYCFAEKFRDMKDIEVDETATQLKGFIEGKRNDTTNWCDWNIPLHIGGMSDPLQPVEKQKRVFYECLKVLVDTQYPYVVSTKGRLLGDEEYLSLIEKSNGVVQVSLVCSSYDKIETGCPSFEERLNIIRKVAPRVKRVIVRIQPYMHEVFDEVFENLEKFKKAGVYGVVVEGMKFPKKIEGLVKVGGDFTYPYDVILSDFLKLKDEAHRVGLKIYAGENRIRKYGDSLSCCGFDGLEGFVGNCYNLNHILNGDKQVPEKNSKMFEEGTGGAFTAISANTKNSKKYHNQSFYYSMLEYYKKKKNQVDIIMGVKKK